MEIKTYNLSDKEFNEIKKIVFNLTGITLSDTKKALVISRLSKRLRKLNINSFSEYLSFLKDNREEIFLVINSITTNHTMFYRERNQFETLKKKILPELLKYKKVLNNNKLRIWSSACSSGEEVYTILFELFEYFNGKIPSNLDLKVLGSDIDTNVLKKARTGIYTADELKGIELSILKKYFDKIDDKAYAVKKRIKEYAIFSKINLVYDDFKFKNPIDILFCRNVTIYFSTETKSRIYEKFHEVMNNPSYYFSGHAESLFNYSHLFKFMEKSIYKKV